MRVFISYRRADLGGHAEVLVGRMYDRLSMRFGNANVFHDIDSIPVGRDFQEFIGEQVAQADVVLVIIGPRWVEELQRRADQYDDFVAIEVQAAIERGLHLIPVLIGGASMPDASDIPEPFSRSCA